MHKLVLRAAVTFRWPLLLGGFFELHCGGVLGTRGVQPPFLQNSESQDSACNLARFLGWEASPGLAGYHMRHAELWLIDEPISVFRGACTRAVGGIWLSYAWVFPGQGIACRR